MFAFSFTIWKIGINFFHCPVTVFWQFSLKSDTFLKFLNKINDTLLKYWRNVRFSCGIIKLWRLNNKCISVMYRIRLGFITCLIRNMLIGLLDLAFIRFGLLDYSKTFYHLLSSCSVEWPAVLW
jgi:hypothetical protein